MNIDSDSTIADFPALEVRDLLKQFTDRYLSSKHIQAHLGSSSTDANKLVGELLQKGYLEETADAPNDHPFRLTVKGRALAHASAAKSILRKTAERHLQDFLDRIREINRVDYWLYRVPEVRLFGSMLSDKPKVSDVDLAFDLELKPMYKSDSMEHIEQRISEAIARGRTFSNFVDQISWPQTEVYRHLKSRSHVLSFSPLSEPVELDVAYQIILQEP